MYISRDFSEGGAGGRTAGGPKGGPVEYEDVGVNLGEYTKDITIVGVSKSLEQHSSINSSPIKSINTYHDDWNMYKLRP